LLPFAVAKIGARGNTIFLRSDLPVASRNFCVNGVVKAQILGDRRQTVIPPTIHPDTKRPYAWETKHTLFDTSLAGLPVAPDNLVDLILTAVADAGYTSDPVEEPKVVPEGGYDEGSPYAELNARALNNLPKWVPDLNLYKCRRLPGYQTYEAVATWRESTEGRELDKRAPNLRITSK
jgi:hypothetical protein